MKRTMTFLIMIALLTGLFAFPSGAVYAQDNGETVDLLVQVDGTAKDTVAKQVKSLGGKVIIRYKNVPVLAVRLPMSKVNELVSFSGVKRIEKDRLVYLTDDTAIGKSSSRPMAYKVEDMMGIKVKAVDKVALANAIQPLGYANFLYTGADLVWEETGYGEGSTVAVIDTGTVPNLCLAHAVVGAPGFPDGFNATGDGIPATDPQNHWHGTVVGGVIASACALDFSADPGNPLYQAISAFLPWPVDLVPLFGQAPLAQLYPVKVFPTDGSGSPWSVIFAGLDHVLTLKKTGVLDVDVVNMSLGGPTVFDGMTTDDLFLLELSKARIGVVSAAGNNGPIPNSIGSPATSLFNLAAGGLDYAPSSRVFYEWLGLVYGADGTPSNGDEYAGMGLVMRPTDETRVVNFSGRGPNSDGRGRPDISALAIWNFHAAPDNTLLWAGGTSFSSPTVAGGMALLNAYWENTEKRETNYVLFRNALLLGANPDVVGEAWDDINDQGFGALDIPAALARLKARDFAVEYPNYDGKLKANILGKPWMGQVEKYQSKAITLAPSETFDKVFKIAPYTSKVTIEIYDIQAPDNSASAYWPNALEVHVQSAKRTDADHPVAIYWLPYFYGDSFTIEIEDGQWTVAGLPWVYQPMEPGLMKVSLAGDYVNETPVSFKMRVARENLRQPLENPIATSPIEMGDEFLVPVEIPAGVSMATFDLVFNRDWSKYPTSDIDMVILDPDGNIASLDGATINAPERAMVSAPAAGTWYVYIVGYEMYKPDTFYLYLTTE